MMTMMIERRVLRQGLSLLQMLAEKKWPWKRLIWIEPHYYPVLQMFLAEDCLRMQLSVEPPTA